MMPPYLPEPKLLIILNGCTEILFGLMLLFPKTQRVLALALILLLSAVFPANFYMYQQGSKQFHFSEWTLLIRLPLQLVLIAWAYYHFRAAKTLN